MRDMFRGYYQPTTQEVEAIWSEGLISLDANVLLSLYNVQEATSALYLNAMEQRRPQMWIPYQVALEFHRNVHKERSKQTTAHQNRIKLIEGLLGDLRSTARKTRLTASDTQKKAVDSLNALKVELAKERDIIAQQTNHRTPDALLERISGLFSGQVGVEPDKATLDVMFKDGETRFADEVPPGFEDAKTKTGNRKYGDYVLWRQLMDHATSEKRDIIFVTDDNKADWWLKIEQTSVAPRPELIQEFRSETGQDILILNSSQFYYHLVPDTTTEAEEDVVLAARQDMSEAVNEAQTASLYERLLLNLPPIEADALRARLLKEPTSTEDKDASLRRQLAKRRALKAQLDGFSTPRWVADPYERRRNVEDMRDRLDRLRDYEADLTDQLDAISGSGSDLDLYRERELQVRREQVRKDRLDLERRFLMGLDDDA